MTTLACAAAPTRDDFAYSMRLQADGKEPLYRVDVPPEVYAHTVSRALLDLRVLNGKGEVVPYAIDRRGEQADAGPPRLQDVPVFPLRGTDTQLAGGLKLSIRTDSGAVEVRSPDGQASKQQLRGYVIDAHAVDRPIAGFDVAWSDGTTDFSELVTVEASSDLTRWQPVTQSSLVNLHFNGQVLRQQRLEFQPIAMRYWRLLWPAHREAIAVSSVRALWAPATPVANRAEKAFALQTGQTNEYLVDLGAQLPVDRVDLRLPERNSVLEATLASRASPADAWRTVARGTFFRLARGDAPEITNDALAIAKNRDRYWRVTTSGAGIGAGMPALVVRWMPESLLFVARGEGPFELVYGSSVATSGETSFDTLVVGSTGQGQHTVQATPTAAMQEAEAGGAARLAPPAPPTPWKKWLLWAVLGLGVLMLAWFAWRLSREL